MIWALKSVISDQDTLPPNFPQFLPVLCLFYHLAWTTPPPVQTATLPETHTTNVIDRTDTFHGSGVLSPHFRINTAPKMVLPPPIHHPQWKMQTSWIAFLVWVTATFNPFDVWLFVTHYVTLSDHFLNFSTVSFHSTNSRKYCSCSSFEGDWWYLFSFLI